MQVTVSAPSQTSRVRAELVLRNTLTCLYLPVQPVSAPKKNASGTNVKEVGLSIVKFRQLARCAAEGHWVRGTVGRTCERRPQRRPPFDQVFVTGSLSGAARPPAGSPSCRGAAPSR